MSPGSPPQSCASFQNTLCPPLLPWAPCQAQLGLKALWALEQPPGSGFRERLAPNPHFPTAWMESQHFVPNTTHDSSDADPGWGLRIGLGLESHTVGVRPDARKRPPEETLKPLHACPSFWPSRCGVGPPTLSSLQPPLSRAVGPDSSPSPPCQHPGPAMRQTWALNQGSPPRLAALSPSQRTHIPQRKPKRPFSSANTRSLQVRPSVEWGRKQERVTGVPGCTPCEGEPLCP